jgi:hypothetical protein
MISTVISFSTLETRFFSALIKEVERFCDDIIVVAYDHFFDGTAEAVAVIEHLKDAYPQTRWLIHEWDANHDSKYWHNNARWTGAEVAKNSRILFLDADEIPDGYLMKRWLEHEPLQDYPLHMFTCYWYFRDPRYQAKTTEGCGLLVDMTKVTKEMFFTHRERWFYSHYPVKPKLFCTMNGNVMFNHYSWVRTKEEMLTKVKSWAHKNDCNWTERVEDEFKHEFTGKDFVHGYSYNTVLNIFDLSLT